jgi:pimeloyl-ACP methyl ester carboxylesterase
LSRSRRSPTATSSSDITSAVGSAARTRRPPVSIADHAADAEALLDHLDVRRAHIAGHSSGAAVAVQLALDHPEYVHTVMLLELSLFSVPSGEAFLTQAQPVLEAYAGGDHAGALAMFMSGVSGLEWTQCRTLLERRVPGAVAQAISDAHTFFDVELPALTEWEFDAEQAAGLHRSVLSVLGGDTQPLWVEVAEFLRSGAATGRRMHDRRRGTPPAHAASRARSARDSRVSRAKPHRQPRGRSVRGSVPET